MIGSTAPTTAAVHLTVDDLHATVACLRRGADDLTRARDRAATQVEALLDGGWRGESARAYTEAWLEWRAGCADVLTALDAMAGLVRAAGIDLVEADVVSQRHLDQVAARMLDRLS